MRVITGTARGMRLETLEGNDVRPTSEKVKEAIFSAINFDIEGRRILDLFAGSGQLGIEALSRGAEKCVFTDASQGAIEVIKRNVQKTGFLKESVVCRTDYASFLRGTKETFDIAFIDPPYNEGLYADAVEKTAKVMSDYGIIVVEHPADVSLPDDTNGFTVYRTYKYGKLVNVTIYKKNTEG
ncbi:MAG: 16S rRNA (guanine(966)-N(2))-methyltransferase RsmD [Clostridia bacterium]|nr:16S rRNA (guanine(966)-N(2))-methyltransferase RsmD [Clostridia bacterium]